MKIVELVNKISLPITNEEADVLGHFEGGKKISRDDLSPRQLIIANHLVNQNVLFRKKDKDGKIYYKQKIGV